MSHQDSISNLFFIHWTYKLCQVDLRRHMRNTVAQCLHRYILVSLSGYQHLWTDRDWYWLHLCVCSSLWYRPVFPASCSTVPRGRTYQQCPVLLSVDTVLGCLMLSASPCDHQTSEQRWWHRRHVDLMTAAASVRRGSKLGLYQISALPPAGIWQFFQIRHKSGSGKNATGAG